MKKTIFSITVLVLLFISSCSPPSETIKIGVIGGFSGEEALIGEYTKNGLELAKSQINSNGGLNGKEIELIYEDSKHLPHPAVSAAKKLIEYDKVSALITLSGASSTMALLPYANEKEFVLMEVFCMIPACHTKGDYLFRASGPPEDQPKFLAEYVNDKLQPKNISLLWINNDYGKSQRDVFVNNYDGVIVSEDNFAQGESEFRTTLTKLANDDPEVLVIISYPFSTGFILQQIGELELDLTTVGTFTSQNPDLLEVAGDFAEGHLFNYMKLGFESEYAKQYRETYLKEYGHEPEIFGTKSHDALLILAEAMKNCEDASDASCVSAELYNVDGLEGASTTITIDDHGDLSSESFEMRVIKNGKFIPLS